MTEYTIILYGVELNSVPLVGAYVEQAEAEAFASGYLTALANNALNWEGTCEIVTWQVTDEGDMTEVNRETYA